MNKILETIYIIGMCILCAVLIVGLLVGFDLTQQPQRESCKSLCIEYDAKFIEYESAFFSSAECWCKTKSNEPLRVKLIH